MSTELVERSGVRVAVEGCGHGTLNAIYSSIQKSCQVKGWDAVDVVIIGGDFQAVRNAQDLNCISMPAKYREIGDFHEYYSGARTAPYLTVFIGGNHEASNHLWELYYGGWAAPNIYYLGAANVVRLGPLRIAGISGIWKGYNYKKPHYERLPYNRDDVRSIYHVRELDVRKLLSVRTQVDIGISHDWPRSVEWDGDHARLFRQKDMFEADSKAGTLGSTAARKVLDWLRPGYWFAAHLHVKFSAKIEYLTDAEGYYGGASSEPKPKGPVVVKNDDEVKMDIDSEEDQSAPQASQKVLAESNTDEVRLKIDDSDEDGVQDRQEAEERHPSGGASRKEDDSVPESIRNQLPASFAAPTHELLPPRTPSVLITNRTTHFLALDKCLPGRKFLQLLEVEPVSEAAAPRDRDDEGRLQLEYDEEWLAITRAFASDLHLGDDSVPQPRHLGFAHYHQLIDKEATWVKENIVAPGKLIIPHNFERTAPIYDVERGIANPPPAVEYNNPQTAGFCELVGIENKFHATEQEKAERLAREPRPARGRGGFRGGRGRREDVRGGGRRGGRGRGRR
ncbi:MAG: hypothetical protein M1825_002455 [Sarcosagium campestre]|nr:MAG: hypothetical protein M1825_002455 [Sarcosagium campestre]